MDENSSNTGTDAAEQPGMAVIESNTEGSRFQRLKNWLWGYDFFISYHWASGGSYAVNLAQQLRHRGFDVFLDREDYASGDNWKHMGAQALRNTRQLVLVATREAVTMSRPVRREVEIFTARGRQVIPILFDDKFADLDRTQYPTLNKLADAQLRIEDSLEEGPTTEVVSELTRTIGVLRRRNRRALITLIPAVAVIIFGVFALYSAWIARISESKAFSRAHEAEKARVSARKEQTRAFANLATANRESANLFWQLAVTARDEDSDGLKATHCFLRAAAALQEIPRMNTTEDDTLFQRNLCLAAHMSSRSLLRSMHHDGPVVGLELSPDGSLVLTWTNDTAVRLWDIQESEWIQTFKHDGRISGAQFSPDSSHVLTWSDDMSARLWRVGSSRPVRIFPHPNPVNGARYSHDGKTVATWTERAMRLWSTTESEPLTTFEYSAGIYGVQFTRDDSRILAWGYGNKTARLWHVDDPGTKKYFSLEKPIHGARFNQYDSMVLVWGGSLLNQTGEVRLWNVDTFEAEPEPIGIFEHTNEVHGAEFNFDESQLLTWTYMQPALLWDVAQSKEIQTFQHETPVTGARFSRDGSRILTWGDDDVRLWSPGQSDPVRVLEHDFPVIGASFAQHKSHVLTWGGQFNSNVGEALLWDVGQSSVLGSYHHGSGWSTRVETKGNLISRYRHIGNVRGARFCDDESKLLTWSDDGTAKLWKTRDCDPGGRMTGSLLVQGFRPSRDGSRVLAWGGDTVSGEAWLWDLDREVRTHTFKHDDEAIILGARLSPDEKYVITWGGHGTRSTLRLWNLMNGEPAQTVSGNTATIIDAFFEEQGQRIFIISADGTVGLLDESSDKVRAVSASEFHGDGVAHEWSNIVVWEGREAKILDKRKGRTIHVSSHNDDVKGARLDRTARQFLSWSRDHSVKLWNISTGAALQTLVHHDEVNNAVFGMDNSRILSCSGRLKSSRTYGEAQLWTIKKKEPLHTFPHDKPVMGAHFIDNESRIITVCNDGSVRYWNCSDPRKHMTPSQRILELEQRSGTTLDDSQELRILSNR